MSLLGETKLWRQADLKLREDNDELSRQLTMLGKRVNIVSKQLAMREQGSPAGSPEEAKLMDTNDGMMFDQVRPDTNDYGV